MIVLATSPSRVAVAYVDEEIRLPLAIREELRVDLLVLETMR